VTGGEVLAGRSRGVAAPVLIDLIGRVRVKRMAMVAVATVAMLVYANAIANGFVLDDGGVIVRNPLVTSPSGAWRAFGLPYWPDAIGGGQYRPLGILSFATDWALSGGDARWFHAVNVLWHAAATLMVWMLAAELLAPVAAGIAGLLFAVHPVHVEAVSNVVGRLEPMGAVFAIGALIAHRRASWMAVPLFALGLLSKESAIVFLALAAANDVVLERDWRKALRCHRWRYAAYGAVTAAYAIVLAVIFHSREFSSPARAFAGTSFGHRLELVARTVPHYVRLLIAPADLSASYAPNVISPAPGFTAMTAFGLVIALLLAVALAVTLRRARWRVLAFALLWVPIALAPVSNVFFPSGVLLAERTLYVASAGVCLAAAAVAERYLLSRGAMVVAATASIVLAFGIRTWTRTPVWHDDRTYLLALLTDHPESYEAHLAAGRALAGANSLDQAEREFVIARRLFPRDSVVYREAADVADRQQRGSAAMALRDSARIAHTLPLPGR
jgi:protein O-mannosyl-transferase